MTERVPYLLASGERVPGVTTVIGRFKEAGGLIHWAWRLGTEGKDYRAVRDDAADAGTLAHKAVETWLKGGAPSFGPAGPVAQKARMAFAAFLNWSAQSNLQVTETEVRMVSEAHRYGGTCDSILIGNHRAIGDWKSGNAVYGEMLIQLAAYGRLWMETHPDDTIDGGYHLIRFDKEHGDFRHFWWSELDEAWEAFLLLRRLYDIDRVLKQRAK